MSILPGLQFGSGYLLASPQTTSGNPAPNPTPLQVGIIQNIKFTLGAEIKSLFGQAQWPVDSAIGKRSIKGSFEFAQISNILLSQLFTGDTVTTGSVQTALGEAHTIPPTSGPYTITVTNASDTPLTDYGVVYAATGIPLENVGGGSLTAAGQYKVNLSSGVYTFDAADQDVAVLISYGYTLTAGTTLSAANHPMGYGPVLALDVWFAYENGNNGLAGIGFYFPNVRLGKIDATTKIDDYTMYQTDFEAFAGAAGVPFNSYQLF